MLCKTGSKRDLNRKWIFEPKFDGTRIFLVKTNKKIKLINRRGRNITYRYPELKNTINNIDAKQCVLDGELVVLNKKGVPDFHLLQQREQLEKAMEIEVRSKEIPASIFVFDILKKDGMSLALLPLHKRKKILSTTVINSPFISACPFTTNGHKLWNSIKNLKMEGVIAKNPESIYEEGVRSPDWLKIKNVKTIDAVIVGFTKEKREISALCLACYVNRKLLYIGRVASGISDDFISEFLPKFRRIIVKKAPVNNPPKTRKEIFWLKPVMVAEVKYLNITKDLELRAPVLLRIRYDKKPEECVIEHI